MGKNTLNNRLLSYFTFAIICYACAFVSPVQSKQLPRIPKQAVVPPVPVTFETGVGCGTVRMRPNHVIQVNSSNFGIANYFNDEACTWAFTASDCDLSIYCPCFQLPGSLGCIEDYLKIGYLKFLDRFCGENPPVGVYRATTDFLTLRFRSNYRETGKGFLCYVRCTATGKADPVPPMPVTCPANAINPFGSPAF